MTEDEAKQKSCPMSFNTPNQADILPCAASMCACWVRDNPIDAKIKLGHCGMIK